MVNNKRLKPRKPGLYQYKDQPTIRCGDANVPYYRYDFGQTRYMPHQGEQEIARRLAKLQQKGQDDGNRASI